MIRTLVASALALGLASPAIDAQQVSLPPARDNTIFGFDPQASNGAGSRIFCGNDIAAGSRRALVRFDVARAIPPGSTITSARLEMTIAQTRSADLPVSLHKLASDWGEAGSAASGGQGGGTAAQTGDATWTHAFWPATTWTSAGGDFATSPSATITCGAFGRFAWSSAQLAADVQDWLDHPATAFGWIVITQETGIQTARAFHSREAATPADRPALVVQYTPPAARILSFGTGCTGGGPQALTLGGIGVPTVPNPGFALSLTGGPSAGLRAVDYFVRLLPSPIPLGQGCDVWGDLATFMYGALSTGTTPLSIPNDSNLIGRSLGVQGLALDPATGQFATSNALLLAFGL